MTQKPHRKCEKRGVVSGARSRARVKETTAMQATAVDIPDVLGSSYHTQHYMFKCLFIDLFI